MMIEIFFVRGLFIGVLFGIPAGAVGAMTVQRSLHKGIRAGLLTGLGSSAADSVYAVIGAFGLTLVSDFFLKYQTMIQCLGGLLILYMGIRMILQRRQGIKTEQAAAKGFQMFLTAFVVGITNPAAILTFLFAFSWFGISGDMEILQQILLVCGVFSGSYLWWIALSVTAGKFRYRMGESGLQRANQVMGMLLCLFSIVIFTGLFL